MKFKIFLGKFLPHNLTPNTWTFDDDFLRKTATWESLSNSIKLTATKQASTFEILCLSTRPINSQAICEKAIYALSTNYLESKKNILIENIDLYKRDASLLSEGESLEDYKKRLTRVERQLKMPLVGPIFAQISEPSMNYHAVNLPEPFLASFSLFLLFIILFEVVYRIIIHSSDYIYFARHVNEKTNIEIKRSFNGHLDQFYSNTLEKDKNYERCMLHLKSILWTIEHESKEKMTSLFLLGFNGIKNSPFLGSLIDNIHSISGDKKYLIVNFSPDLCSKTTDSSESFDDFLRGSKKWKQCYKSLDKPNIHYTEIKNELSAKDNTNLTKSLKIFSKSYDKVICIGPSSHQEFVEQKLISHSDDIYLIIRTQSSKWRQLTYFLDTLESYHSKFRASWMINSLT